MPQILDNTLVFSIICDKCGSNKEKLFIEEQSVRLINNINEYYIAPNEYIINLKKYIAIENVSLEFRLENIGETRNYFIKEINQNDSMSKKYKKPFTDLNHIFASAVLGVFQFLLLLQQFLFLQIL